MPRPTWIPKLMAAMGWPDDGAGSLALDLWSLSEDRSEQMQNEAHNYIAIIWPPGIDPPWNTFKGSDGRTYHVQRYANEAAGVAATARFLQQSTYSLIDQAFLAPFRKGWKIENIYLRINGSMPWGDQGGHYPIVLYNWLYRRRGSLPSPYIDTTSPPPPSAKVPITIFTAWRDLMHQFSQTMPSVIRKFHAETVLIRRQNK